MRRSTLLALVAVAGCGGDPSGPGPAGPPIAFVSERDSNEDTYEEIYVMNADGSAVTRLTNHPASDHDPAWSPDRSKLAFVSDRDGARNIYVMNADGSGVTRLTAHASRDLGPVWSPDKKNRVWIRSRRQRRVVRHECRRVLRHATDRRPFH